MLQNNINLISVIFLVSFQVNASGEVNTKKPYINLRDVYERCESEPGKSYQESCEKWYQKFASAASEIYNMQGTLLHDAVNKNNIAAVELLIKIGSDVNALNYSENTPLINAVRDGNGAIAKLLIDNGANPNNCSDRFTGSTRPLVSAIFNGNFQIIKLLVEAGADIYAIDIDGRSAVGSAWNSGQYAILDYLKQYEQAKKG